MISAARLLIRLTLAALLALAWVGGSPAGISFDPHNANPTGIERADSGLAILSQRLSGAVAVRSSVPDGNRTTLSGDPHPAIPPGDLTLPSMPQGGRPAISIDRAAPAGWTVHGYHARAPPAA